MTRTRRKVPCPTDLTLLGYGELVETRANGEYIYYCEDCKNYWIVTWIKKKSESGKSWSWAIQNVRDDFGSSFDYIKRPKQIEIKRADNG